MSNIDEKTAEAAREYAERESAVFNHKSARAITYIQSKEGFIAGANWALSHQWRSVEKALPKYDGKILLCRDSYWVALCTWEKDRFVNTSNGYVFMATHWMPIPPLPQARKEEE